MIKYSYPYSEKNTRVIRFTIFSVRWFIAIGIPCLVVFLSLLIIGLQSNKILVYISYVFMFCFLLSLSYCVKYGTTFRKQLDYLYKYYSVDGKIDYVLENDADKITLKCIQNGQDVCFSKSDVVSYKRMKRVIIIKVKSNVFLDLPNTKEVIEILGLKSKK